MATAKAYFMVIGLVQQIALKAVLGLDGYGALSNVLSVGSIAYNPIVTTSIQGVSRAVAETPDEDQPAAVRRTLGVHFLLTPLLAGGFLFAAPWIGPAMGAPHLVPALQWMSGVLFAYGLYAPLIGVLNGRKRFVWQAGFDIASATLRTVGLLVGGYWALRAYQRGVEGSTIGFVLAAFVVLAGAFAVVGIGRRGAGGTSVRRHVLFIMPLALGQLVLNLLFQADLTLLRFFAAESAASLGLDPTAADPFAGAYRATQLFSFLPYQLLMAVTFVIFPLLVTAYRDRQHEAVRSYTRSGIRLSLVLTGGMVAITSGLSGPLLRLVFGNDAAVLATEAMELLTLGFGAFALFGIFTTILNSLKKELQATGITLLAFALVVALGFAWVRGAPLTSELLWRTAVSTSVSILVATLVAAGLVWRTTGAVVAPSSLVRVLLATGVGIAVGRWLPDLGLTGLGRAVVTVGYSGVVGLVYLVLLVASFELGRADLALVKKVVSRSR